MIKVIEIYKTKGKTFDTFTQAVRYRDDLIGKFIDDSEKNSGSIYGPKVKLALHKYMIEHKEELRDLLNYSSEEAEEEYPSPFPV